MQREKEAAINKSSIYWRSIVQAAPEIGLLTINNRFFPPQRSAVPNESVLGIVSGYISKNCFLYLFHRNTQRCNPRESRTSFGLHDPFLPLIRSTDRMQKLFLLDFWRYSHGPAPEISTKSANQPLESNNPSKNARCVCGNYKKCNWLIILLFHEERIVYIGRKNSNWFAFLFMISNLNIYKLFA